MEDGRFDYIESGSLLGVTYENVPSLPVGYESELTLYPLSFEEFCWALGENETALEMARSVFSRKKPPRPPSSTRSSWSCSSTT